MKTRYLLLILIFVTLIAYFNSFWNQFVWDDEQFIQKNLFITSFKYLPQIFTTNTIAGAGQVSNYYRPLTTLSFLVDYQIWGLNPFGFHLTNTFLHISNGLMLFWLLKRLKMPQIPAFWLSLVYLVHPAQTEAVTYVNSRGDSLYVFWLLVSLLLFIFSFQQRKLNLGQRFHLSKELLLFGSLITYGASILSKEIALGLAPLYLGLLLLVHYQEKIPWGKLVTQIWMIAGLVGVVFGYIGLRLSVLNFANSLNFYGADNIYTQNLAVRMFTFGRVFWEYFGIISIPFPLHMERNSPIMTSFFSPWVILALVLIVGLFGLSVWRLKKYCQWWLLVGMFVAGLAIFPVSGVVPINGLLYEHWLYLPLVGVLLMVYGFYQLFEKQISLNSSWAQTLGGLLIIIYIFLTIYQNYLWSSPIRFYEYTLKYADSARLHNNLAMAYSDQQQLMKAIPEYQKAISLSDSYPQTHHNLANAYFDLGKFDLAEGEYLKALKLDPKFYFSYPKLVLLYIQTKQFAKAKPYLDKLIEVAPSDEGVLNLNQLYLKTTEGSASVNLPLAK